MNKKTLKKIKTQYKELAIAAANFAKNLISSTDIKKKSAPLGIYEQKNGKFMMRIRITGGELNLQEAETIAKIAEKYGADKLHLTTRQDIQLHNVQAEFLADAVQDFFNAGMPFHGGGGDTLRNITSCPHAGYSEKSIFNTTPFARGLWEGLADFDKAFSLPRKFKIAFSCCEDDFSMAKFNDLGFIAKIANGQKGFEVFAGGGMGRESNPGIKIFDFVPEKEIYRIAVAAITFFYDFGNRNDRSKARFRFVLREKGEKEFRKTFAKYLESADGEPDFKITEKSETPSNAQLAKLFIPHGDISPKEFANLAKTAFSLGATRLRISQSQDIFIVGINEEAKEKILSKFPKYSANKFKALIKSCVGASVCKIGLLDAPTHAEAVSEKILSITKSISNPKKRKAVEEILSKIRISGCHNSCGHNRAVEFGFQGKRKKIGETMKDFYVFQHGGRQDIGKISEDSGQEIPAEELPDFVTKILEERLGL